MSAVGIYSAFLGDWRLIPESCQYDQGEAPASGSYRISVGAEGILSLTTQWKEPNGQAHSFTLSGKPDGSKAPFDGGDLADALAITAVSPRELNSYAYLRGKELMVAQRQLDDTGRAMRVTQLVRLPDGTRPSNVSVYLKEG